MIGDGKYELDTLTITQEQLIKEEQEQLRQLQLFIVEHNKSLDKLKIKLEDASKDYRQQISQNELELQEVINVKKERIIKLERETEQLKRELKECKHEHRTEEQKLLLQQQKLLEAEREEYTQQITEKESHLEKMKESLNEKDEKVTELERLIEQLRTRLEDSEQHRLRQLLGKQDTTVSDMRRIFENELEDCRKQTIQKEEEHSLIMKLNEQNEAENKSLRTELDNYKLQLQTFKEIVDATRKRQLKEAEKEMQTTNQASSVMYCLGDETTILAQVEESQGRHEEEVEIGTCVKKRLTSPG